MIFKPFCILSCILLLASFFYLSCNQPFQQEVQYNPKFNVYSILFANSEEVYVRVMSVTKSQSDMSEPVHGATVKLFGTGPDTATQNVTLADTTEVIDGDTASFYYARAHIIPSGIYFVSVSKEGYPTVNAHAYVPYGYATIPDAGTYSILRNPKNIKSSINFKINLSQHASAEFVQMAVEYRGLDSTGNLHAEFFSVFSVDSVNPFSEITSLSVPMTIDTLQYQNAYNLAGLYAATMRVSHMYVDIIVTQVDDGFYRFFITSNRTLDPLQMRTDKIVFTNIFNNAGTGIVSGVSVDTTRIFLF